MTVASVDKVFAGSIPNLYETYLVPLIFAPYAQDLAGRLAARKPPRVLEIAAGTGVVTRAMDAALPAESSITATDLNQAMLDEAAVRGTRRSVVWQQADAMQLPFDDASFDAVVCQFGAMFFPDKPKAFREARRVLRKSGVLLFNVWDRIEVNEFADCVTSAVGTLFPRDPPRFLARTPHGYHDRARIEQDLAEAGFDRIAIETLPERSRAASPRDPAVAYCEGTPLRNEIEARDATALQRATEVATQALARRFGTANIDGLIQAHVITVET